MTRRYRSSLNTNAPLTGGMKPGTEEEHLEQAWKTLQQHEAGKSIGARPQNGTTDGNLNDTKALKPSSRSTLLTHVFWAIFAWLLVIFAINGFNLVPITASDSSTFSVKAKSSAATLPASLSQDIDSSSSLLGSHTTPATPTNSGPCILSPQHISLLCTVLNACYCPNRSSTEDVGTVTVTFTTTVFVRTVFATASAGKLSTDSTRTVTKYYHDSRLCAACNSDKLSQA